MDKTFTNKELNADNWFNYADFYNKVVSDNAFKVFVEVGVWKGHSVSFLAKTLLAKGGYFELYAVDYWNKLPKDKQLWESHANVIPDLYELYSTNLVKNGVRGHVFDLLGDSSEQAALFEDGSVDFVFIDASHDTASVIKDINAWKPKVRKGGILAGHDIHESPVRKAVEMCLDNVVINDNSDVWHLRIK